jgi:hypothetical protein
MPARAQQNNSNSTESIFGEKFRARILNQLKQREKRREEEEEEEDTFGVC